MGVGMCLSILTLAVPHPRLVMLNEVDRTGYLRHRNGGYIPIVEREMGRGSVSVRTV